jgi:hypothetical protein
MMINFHPTKMKKNLLLAILLVLQSIYAYSQLNYPKTKTVAQTDDYFGTKVNDPYRWLEDDRSQETKAGDQSLGERAKSANFFLFG